MRTMMKVTIPVDAGNDAIADGSLPATLESVMEKVQPEAAYFLTNEGQRCAIMVFDLADVSDIPTIAEPFFTNMHASVEFSPVMNREDLQAGLAAGG